MLGLNILSDRHDQYVAWYVNILFSGRPDARTSVLDSADHLRSHINTSDMMVFVYIQGCRRFQSLQFNTFCHRSFNLCRKRCHIRHSSAVYDADLLRAQSLRCADRIHGNISASDNSHMFAGKIHDLFLSYVAQELYRRKDAVSVFPFQSQLFIRAGSNGDQHCVILVSQLLNRNILSDL